MTDNPSLLPEIIDRYKSMYTGVFYNRFILGQWVAADGIVYDVDVKTLIDDTVPKKDGILFPLTMARRIPFLRVFGACTVKLRRV